MMASPVQFLSVAMLLLVGFFPDAAHAIRLQKKVQMMARADMNRTGVHLNLLEGLYIQAIRPGEAKYFGPFALAQWEFLQTQARVLQGDDQWVFKVLDIRSGDVIGMRPDDASRDTAEVAAEISEDLDAPFGDSFPTVKWTEGIYIQAIHGSAKYFGPFGQDLAAEVPVPTGRRPRMKVFGRKKKTMLLFDKLMNLIEEIRKLQDDPWKFDILDIKAGDRAKPENTRDLVPEITQVLAGHAIGAEEGVPQDLQPRQSLDSYSALFRERATTDGDLEDFPDTMRPGGAYLKAEFTDQGPLYMGAFGKPEAVQGRLGPFVIALATRFQTKGVEFRVTTGADIDERVATVVSPVYEDGAIDWWESSQKMIREVDKLI